MRRIIAIATLSLVLSFPALSYASGHMDLYTKPTAPSEVKNEIKGGDVEKDFTSFYTSPKAMGAGSSLTSDAQSNDESLLIFGVRIVR
ncbi:MAG: hypothetical protein HY693_00695 [Deltaproteobacteria bacterium]|nr:hypothetical protein [Deltaproteobacteria bacterium]